MAHSPTLILDTHAAVHELVSAGMPERQAETVVRQQARLLEQNLATKTDLATIKADIEALRQETKTDIATIKADIETLRQETKAGIEALRQETKALIETAKVDLIKWIFGLNIATMSLLVAAIKLL
jgi:uncharacterized membrane protein YqiK